MSALPLRADIQERGKRVRFGPKADISGGFGSALSGDSFPPYYFSVVALLLNLVGRQGCEHRHMKIVMMATGGVGGYYGARLAAADEDVHFIARGAHLAALRTNGLKLISANGDLHL